MGCCQPVLGPIENYYTKYQVDQMLEEIESAITSGCCITPEEVDEKIDEAVSGITPDLSDYYTKEEVDALIPEVPSLSGYATEQWVEDKHYITGVDLSDYATKEEIPSLSGYATEEWVENKGYLTEHQHLKTINGQSLVGDGDIEIGTGGTIDLSDYYTTAQTVNLVESAVTVVEGEIPTVPTSNTAFTNDAGYLTEHQSLSGYATEQWVEDKHYITGVDLSDYALKSEIPTVPTSNTAFTNDAGYLTEHQSLKTINNQTITGTGNINIECECSGVTSGEVQTMIDQSVSGKVDVSVYSAYTASTQITISNKADSSTLNNYLLKSKIWCGTQSEWAQISGNTDSETIYLIHS